MNYTEGNKIYDYIWSAVFMLILTEKSYIFNISIKKKIVLFYNLGHPCWEGRYIFIVTTNEK